MRADMSVYSSKLAETAIRPVVFSRCLTWNQGWAIWTPRALASSLRATQAPSLELRTTPGLPISRGLNTRSQLTYMLLASTSASMASDLQLLDDRGDDAPDHEPVVFCDGDVDVLRVGGLELCFSALAPQAPTDHLAIDHSDHD